jgi:hypothetical protein
MLPDLILLHIFLNQFELICQHTISNAVEKTVVGKMCSREIVFLELSLPSAFQYLSRAK